VGLLALQAIFFQFFSVDLAIQKPLNFKLLSLKLYDFRHLPSAWNCRFKIPAFALGRWTAVLFAIIWGKKGVRFGRLLLYTTIKDFHQKSKTKSLIP
jgi:hypothetical protein